VLVLDIFQFLGSMLMIYFSAEFIVRYGKEIAISLGVSRYVIGLTLIAFGTSFPEFVVSMNASIMNEPGIVFGNVIGSNIANIALVLSVCAIIKHINCDKVGKQDLVFFLLSAVFAFFASLDGNINQLEGFILLFGFIFYCYMIKRNLVIEKNKSIKQKEKRFNFYIVIIIFCSFFILISGSNLFINSAISLAERFNVTNLAISMTLIAIGTSLPELATSIIAVINKEYELLTGNIIGSNIMNILMILGPSAIINTINIEVDYIAIVLMLLLTLLIYGFNIFNIKISRIMGIILFIIYSVFIYSNFYKIA
tara:strand:- start:378 stop:1307 length:930 start_codon:yes stop_codon:yes gene_type:complete